MQVRCQMVVSLASKGVPLAGEKHADRVELLELSERTAEDPTATATEDSAAAAPEDSDTAASSTDTPAAAEPSDTLDQQSTEPTKVTTSASVEDQMSTFESHQKDSLLLWTMRE